MKPRLAGAWMALMLATAVQADEPKEAPATVASVTEAPPVKTADQIAAEDKSARERADRAREREAFTVRQLRTQGYKPQTKKDGTVLWCRNETPIGSHLEQVRCASLENILDTTQKGQELTNRLFGNKNIKLYGD
jgi:hypothetical protein